jgi:hypothetical protein
MVGGRESWSSTLPNTNGFRGLCLEPADLAVSMLAAARPKDIEFVHVLLREHIVSPDTLRTRVESVPSLDSVRKLQPQQLVARLTP